MRQRIALFLVTILAHIPWFLFAETQSPPPPTQLFKDIINGKCEVAPAKNTLAFNIFLENLLIQNGTIPPYTFDPFSFPLRAGHTEELMNFGLWAESTGFPPTAAWGRAALDAIGMGLTAEEFGLLPGTSVCPRLPLNNGQPPSIKKINDDHIFDESVSAVLSQMDIQSITPNQRDILVTAGVLFPIAPFTKDALCNSGNDYVPDELINGMPFKGWYDVIRAYIFPIDTKNVIVVERKFRWNSPPTGGGGIGPTGPVVGTPNSKTVIQALGVVPNTIDPLNASDAVLCKNSDVVERLLTRGEVYQFAVNFLPFGRFAQLVLENRESNLFYAIADTALSFEGAVALGDGAASLFAIGGAINVFHGLSADKLVKWSIGFQGGALSVRTTGLMCQKDPIRGAEWFELGLRAVGMGLSATSLYSNKIYGFMENHFPEGRFWMKQGAETQAACTDGLRPSTYTAWASALANKIFRNTWSNNPIVNYLKAAKSRYQHAIKTTGNPTATQQNGVTLTFGKVRGIAEETMLKKLDGVPDEIFEDLYSSSWELVTNHGTWTTQGAGIAAIYGPDGELLTGILISRTNQTWIKLFHNEPVGQMLESAAMVRSTNLLNELIGGCYSRTDALRKFWEAAFYLANRMPTERGSAAILRSFLAGYYRRIFGKTITIDPNIDVKAMTTDLEMFISRFIIFSP